MAKGKRKKNLTKRRRKKLGKQNILKIKKTTIWQD